MRSISVKNQKLTLAADILLYFLVFVDMLPRPFEGRSRYTKRLFSGKVAAYGMYRVMKKLEQKGWLKVYKESGNNLFALTKSGQLEALFIKARLAEKVIWDGKWRMVVFDIPEEARHERNKLRELLNSNGYRQVQKSVYINPYPLNREAIIYLKQTGLDKYIRIFRIDEADNHKALKKLFGL